MIHVLVQRIRERIGAVSLWFRLAVGGIQGLFGALLLQFGIHVSTHTLIDLRIVPVMIAAKVGGAYASITAAIIITIVRVMVYPYALSAQLTAIIMMTCGIAFGFVVKSRLKDLAQWWVMAGVFSLLIGVSIWSVIPGDLRAALLLAQYVFSTVAAVYVTYVLQSHLWKSQAAMQRLQKLSSEDFLTGLYNSRSFNHAIYEQYAFSVEHKVPLSLLVIDLDHFKDINDTHGHPVGDEMLRQVGEVFLQSCRKEDIVCRTGGEEFSIIVPECDAQCALDVAERIRVTVQTYAFAASRDVILRLTISIGVSTLREDAALSETQLIQRADRSLYEAKHNGRNRVCVYDELDLSS